MARNAPPNAETETWALGEDARVLVGIGGGQDERRRSDRCAR